MASDGRENDTMTVSVPPEVGDWLDEQATRHESSREAICRQLLQGVRDVSADGDLADAEELASLRAHVEAQREEFIDHVEDVRERVVQVKREVDGRAPAEHDHERYADADAVRELESTIDDVAADVEAIDASLQTLADRVDEGFDSYETILDDLAADLELVSDRSTVLANAVLDLRDTRTAMQARANRRGAADEVKLAANRLGVRSASCADCGSSVEIALLTTPTCPHCGASIADVERRSSILGSHTLVTGEPPALPGDPGHGGPQREQLEEAADATSAASNEGSHD